MPLAENVFRKAFRPFPLSLATTLSLQIDFRAMKTASKNAGPNVDAFGKSRCCFATRTVGLKITVAASVSYGDR
jgi:hypothetical protein